MYKQHPDNVSSCILENTSMKHYLMYINLFFINYLIFGFQNSKLPLDQQ